jgi:hypothetical protein
VHVEPPRLALTRLPEARRVAVEALAAELGGHYPTGRRMLAVDGAGGETQRAFADDLALAFRARGEEVFRASAADFTNDIVRALLDPFRMNGGTGFVLGSYDPERRAPRVTAWTTGPADAILIVDGVGLQEAELRGRWNAAVWVDVVAPSAVDPVFAGPRERASAVYDLRDPASPRRVFADAC